MLGSQVHHATLHVHMYLSSINCRFFFLVSSSTSLKFTYTASCTYLTSHPCRTIYLQLKTLFSVPSSFLHLNSSSGFLSSKFKSPCPNFWTEESPIYSFFNYPSSKRLPPISQALWNQSTKIITTLTWSTKLKYRFKFKFIYNYIIAI